MRFLRLKHLLITHIAVGLMTANIFAQPSEKDTAFMFHRFTTTGASLQSMSEYGFAITQQMQSQPNLNLVIRLCSSQEIATAVGTAAVDPISLTWFLMNAETIPKISVDRILVEVSPECVENKSLSTATELWLIPKSKASNYTQICACRLREVQYKSNSGNKENFTIGTKKYREAFNRLHKDVDSELQDAGFVIGYFNIGSAKSVKKQLLNLKNYANKKKLNSKKIFWGVLNWNREDSVGEIKNVVIKAIRITDECAENGKLPETIFIE